MNIAKKVGNISKISLNTSQQEIAAGEDAFPGTALYTVAANMHFAAFTAKEVAAACDKVLENADIFRAALVREEHTYVFHADAKTISHCVVTAPKTYSQADSLFERMKSEQLHFPDETYKAVAFDVTEGGSCLILAFHHVITDGFGISIFAQNVADILEGRAVTPSLFFAGNEVYEADKDTSEDEKFFREYFADSDAEASIFTEKADGLAKFSQPAAVDGDIQAVAQNIAKRAGVHLPYVYAAALALYLYAATGKHHAAFLMPRLNRARQTMSVIGCYTLLVPVDVPVDAGDTFDEVCRKVQQSSKAASLHKSLGYARILKLLKEEAACDMPMQYGFNWYAKPLVSDTDIELTVSTSGAMQGHLTWNFFVRRNGLCSAFDARTGIYDEQRVKSLDAALCRILRECGGSNACAADCEAVGEEEKLQLGAVRGKEYCIDGDDTIPSLFRRAVSANRDLPALYAGDKQYTFAQLDSLTDNMARNLISKGIQPGDRVAFLLRRNALLVPTLLGISKSGAAFIPVDPSYPKDRIEHILTDSGARYLITSKEVMEAGTVSGYSLIDVCRLTEKCDDRTEFPIIRQGDLAYMIYTSGTTGRPKGVMLSHRGIVNIVHPDNNPFNRDVVRNGHGIVAIGSICFDISLFEIFVPLFNGKFVVLGDEKAMIDAGALSECIRSHGEDILHCTPSRIAAYLANPDFKNAISNIRMILSAGEVLPANLVITLKEEYGIRIYNGYGPTETTIGATITEAGDYESIGRPIGNTAIILLNSSGGQVPFGAVGEICVSGPGLGLGYYNRDEETAAKFVTFDGKPIYRTGDLGHFRKDGRLIYHGRCDRQVKLRGLRIELSEIESVMQQFAGITQSACVLKKTKHSEHLVGFYTHENGEDVGEALKAHMKAHLTEYMVPDLLVKLDAMPQTPGGKLDVRALGKIEVSFERRFVAPRNETERLLCEAFAAVMEEEDGEVLGVEDNFFEAGMDSLLATSFLLAIEEKLPEADVKYADIYAYPTAESLASKLKAGADKGSGYAVGKLDYTGFDSLFQDTGAAGAGRDIRRVSMGSVLLTGATGYLGIHILLELLKTPGSFDRVICLARPKGKNSAERRMKSSLFYYGEDDFSGLYGTKWSVVEADITDEDFSQKVNGPVDTIIHAAANVAHFSHDDAIEHANIDGVRNMIRFAIDKNACLCQVSTISVGGVEKRGEKLPAFTEKDLYIGQKIHNQYIYSKFMAEYEIMRAAIDKGLRFKIMRVGNLQGRIRDGEFQMNMKTNNFTRCLSSYVKMGVVPMSVYGASVNFSPVDEVARMIAALSAVNRDNMVFHVSPQKETAFADIFAALEKNGHTVTPVPDEVFEGKVEAYKRDRSRQEAVEGLLAEKPDGNDIDVPVTQHGTSAVLDAMGLEWEAITEDYLEKYINALEQMGMF